MSKSLTISGVMVAFISLITWNCFGDDHWIYIGPEGGNIKAFAINPQTPDTLFA
jgi:hypothetical protein